MRTDASEASKARNLRHFCWVGFVFGNMKTTPAGGDVAAGQQGQCTGGEIHFISIPYACSSASKLCCLSEDRQAAELRVTVTSPSTNSTAEYPNS